MGLTPIENAWIIILKYCCTGCIDDYNGWEDMDKDEMNEIIAKYGIYIGLSENDLIDDGLENFVNDNFKENKENLHKCVNEIKQILEITTDDNEIKDYIKTLLDKKTNIGKTYLEIIKNE